MSAIKKIIISVGLFSLSQPGFGHTPPPLNVEAEGKIWYVAQACADDKFLHQFISLARMRIGAAVPKEQFQETESAIMKSMAMNKADFTMQECKESLVQLQKIFDERRKTFKQYGIQIDPM